MGRSRQPSVVDRAARQRFAQLTRQFVSGRMTNDEYDEAAQALIYGTEDTALHAIFWPCLWSLYDDFRTHKLTGKWRLNRREDRRRIAQIVLFLQSDLPYEWPPDTFRLRGWFLRALETLSGGRLSFPSAHWEDGFESSAWPFRTNLALASEALRPRLLCGQPAE